jgi:hypothetical protein
LFTLASIYHFKVKRLYANNEVSVILFIKMNVADYLGSIVRFSRSLFEIYIIVAIWLVFASLSILLSFVIMLNVMNCAGFDLFYVTIEAIFYIVLIIITKIASTFLVAIEYYFLSFIFIIFEAIIFLIITK